MPKKITIQTQKNSLSVGSYIDGIENEQLRKDSKALIGIFKKVTGKKPKMWGTSIVGFGEMTYYRSNGDYGEMPALGFSPRKSGPTLYIMSGFSKSASFNALMKKIGPHKKSKACLYLKSLEKVDLKALEKLLAGSLKALKQTNELR